MYLCDRGEGPVDLNCPTCDVSDDDLVSVIWMVMTSSDVSHDQGDGHHMAAVC